MNKDDIISLPNKHLRRPSKKVSIITAQVRKLAADMQEATLSWENSRDHEVGVALAAIQVDKPEKVVIIRNNFDDKSDRSFSVFINPKIIKKYGELVEDFEGCLSVKNIYGKVPRYSKVKIKAQDLNGKEVRVSAEGFLARVFQHEIDHTKGIIFLDHIKDKKDAFFFIKDDGKLEQLDYDSEIKNNAKLWD